MFYALLSVIIIAMIFFANKAYIYAKNYENINSSLVKHMSVENLAEFQLKELAASLSFGYYKNNKKDEISALKQKAKTAKKFSYKNTLYFMLLLFIVSISYFFISLRVFTFFGSVSATITLIFGLITPIMMVTIHKEVEYLGDVILSFESKSIIGTIGKLFENGDTIVAIVILLFSILIPSLKTLSLAFVSIFMKNQFAHGIVKFFKIIGKWSMVDVFVVATFLVYLTIDKGDVSRAEIEAGLYFFLAYVIISMIVSLSADKMLHKRCNEKNVRLKT